MAIYFAVRTNVNLTSIYAYVTDCDKTFAVIAFFFMINVIEEFVADNALVNIGSFVELFVG